MALSNSAALIAAESTAGAAPGGGVHGPQWGRSPPPHLGESLGDGRARPGRDRVRGGPEQPQARPPHARHEAADRHTQDLAGRPSRRRGLDRRSARAAERLRLRRRARAQASGRSRLPCQRITSGIAASIRSSSEGYVGAIRMLRSRGSRPYGNEAPAGVRAIPAPLASSTTRAAVPSTTSRLTMSAPASPSAVAIGRDCCSASCSSFSARCSGESAVSSTTVSFCPSSSASVTISGGQNRT